MNWIYDKENDNSARYTLSPKSENYLFCFGINPSTAAPEKLDNTVKSVERIAKRHNFDTFMMLNIYPLYLSNNEMLKEFEIDKYISSL
jgi:hypothetical protein